MSKRDAKLYLEDLLASIEKIEAYVMSMSFEQFDNDEKTVDAVVRNLEIIGEAATNIPLDIRTAHPEIPWRDMTSMRNKILHEYFGVDTEILWETIHEDLPLLKTKIKLLPEL